MKAVNCRFLLPARIAEAWVGESSDFLSVNSFRMAVVVSVSVGFAAVRPGKRTRCAKCKAMAGGFILYLFEISCKTKNVQQQS